MTHMTKNWGKLAAAVVAGLGLLIVNEHGSVDGKSPIVSSAEARIGRPLTPMSYAGVARRTTRRAVAVGAAAGAAGAYYYRPGCVQVVNAYGQVVYRCP